MCQGVRGSLVCDDVHRLPSTVHFVRSWLQTKPFSFPWWFEFGWTLASQQSSSCSPFSLASHQLPSISSLSAWAWPPGNTICLPSLLVVSMHTTSSTTNSKIFWKKVAGLRFVSKEAELQLSTAHLRIKENSLIYTLHHNIFDEGSSLCVTKSYDMLKLSPRKKPNNWIGLKNVSVCAVIPFTWWQKAKGKRT